MEQLGLFGDKTKIHLKGDTTSARQYIGEVKRLLHIFRDLTRLGNLNTNRMEHRYPDGTIIRLFTSFGQELIEVITIPSFRRGKKKKLEIPILRWIAAFYNQCDLTGREFKESYSIMCGNLRIVGAGDPQKRIVFEQGVDEYDYGSRLAMLPDGLLVCGSVFYPDTSWERYNNLVSVSYDFGKTFTYNHILDGPDPYSETLDLDIDEDGVIWAIVKAYWVSTYLYKSTDRGETFQKIQTIPLMGTGTYPEEYGDSTLAVSIKENPELGEEGDPNIGIAADTDSDGVCTWVNGTVTRYSTAAAHDCWINGVFNPNPPVICRYQEYPVIEFAGDTWCMVCNSANTSYANAPVIHDVRYEVVCPFCGMIWVEMWPGNVFYRADTSRYCTHMQPVTGRPPLTETPVEFSSDNGVETVIFRNGSIVYRGGMIATGTNLSGETIYDGGCYFYLLQADDVWSIRGDKETKHWVMAAPWLGANGERMRDGGCDNMGVLFSVDDGQNWKCVPVEGCTWSAFGDVPVSVACDIHKNKVMFTWTSWLRGTDSLTSRCEMWVGTVEGSDIIDWQKVYEEEEEGPFGGACDCITLSNTCGGKIVVIDDGILECEVDDYDS